MRTHYIEVDGKRYSIEGPDDATDDELFDAVVDLYPEDFGDETPERSSLESISRMVGSFLTGVSPYVAAAGAGAAATAPTVVGTPFGAAAGGASLMAADLLTAIANAGLTTFGQDPLAYPSTTIRESMLDAGIGIRPETSTERVLQLTGELTAGGAALPASARQLLKSFAPRSSAPPPRLPSEVATAFGRGVSPNLRIQTGAGAGTGVGIGTAQELDIENPAAQTVAGIGGGLLGGRFMTRRPTAPTPTQLLEQANAGFEAAKQAGVRFSKDSISNLSQNIARRLKDKDDISYDEVIHTDIKRLLDRISNLADQTEPVSFSELERIRRTANGVRSGSSDSTTRRLANSLINDLDSFVQTPPTGAIIAGEGQVAARGITQARTAYRRFAQGQDIDEIIDRARTRSGADGALTASNLRAEFRTVVRNPNRLRKFDPQIQSLMREFVDGNIGTNVLEQIGAFAPTSLRLRPLLLGAGAANFVSEGAMDPATAAGLFVGAGTGRKAADILARRRAQEIATVARGGTPAERSRQFSAPVSSLLSATETGSSRPSPQEEAVQTYLGLLGQTGTPSGPYRN